MLRARLKTTLSGLLVALLIVSAPLGAETLVLAAANTHPTAFLVDGEPSGILVDLVTEAYRRAGHSVTIKLMPWARCLEEARNGAVDGVFSSFRLPERERFLAFPKERLSAQTIAFFARDNSPLRFDGDLGALSGVKIGVILGTSYGKRFDTAIEAGLLPRIDQGNSIEGNLRKLVLGRVDLIPSFRDVAIDTAKRLGLLEQIRELAPPIEVVPTYLAFTRVRDLGKLADDFDRAIASMRQDGSYQRIVERYRVDWPRGARE